MKVFSLLLVFTTYSLMLNAQTNTFPSSGNVGIGTINPTSKLEVSGQLSSYYIGIGQIDVATSSKNFVNLSSNNHASVLLSSNLYISHDDNLKIANTHPSLSGASILMPGNTQANQGGILFYTNTPAPVIADADFSGAAAMFISPTGNVGVGTLMPNTKLAVNGNIRAKEVKVENANWPDYVFAKHYELPTLQSTEQQIKANGHLPGIPSAAEVKVNGVDLGAMNAKLLQKIEELTLYLIEQSKAIEAQNKKIETQQMQINNLIKNR